MREIESGVSKHYSSYDVLDRIRAGLREMGHDPNRISPDVLKPVDEFHIGGADATAALLAKLDIRPESDVLDIGSGIGGPARMIAFPMIWLGLAIYTGSMLRQARRNRATLAVRDA